MRVVFEQHFKLRAITLRSTNLLLVCTFWFVATVLPPRSSVMTVWMISTTLVRATFQLSLLSTLVIHVLLRAMKVLLTHEHIKLQILPSICSAGSNPVEVEH